MKFKGTKGPWKMSGYISEAGNHGHFNINADNWREFIEVCKHETRTLQEASANAKLISASPELLEALQTILKEGENSNNEELKFVARVAKQAINKAL